MVNSKIHVISLRKFTYEDKYLNISFSGSLNSTGTMFLVWNGVGENRGFNQLLQD